MRIPVSIDTASRDSTEFFCLAGALGAAVVLVSIVLLLRALGLMQPAELALYDFALRSQARSDTAASQLALVTITEADIQGMATWPPSDAMLARILTRLGAGEPAAIGLDIFRDHSVGEGDAALTAVLAAHPEIVIVHYVASAGQRTAVKPPPALRDRPERVGFANLIVDRGGVVRRSLLFMGDDDGEVHTSFALQLALKRLALDNVFAAEDRLHPEFLRLGAATIEPFRADDGAYVGADDGEYQFLIDYRDNLSAVPSWSLADVLDGQVDVGLLKGRVVLVGVTAQSVKDVFDTPLNRSLMHPELPMFGLELQARLVAQLLRMARTGALPPKPLAQWFEVLLIALAGMLAALAGLRSQSLLRFVLVCALAPLAWLVLAVGTLWAGWWLPAVAPAASWIMCAVASIALVAAVQKRQRDRIFGLFSRFCSAEVVDEIWRHRDDLLGVGQTTPLTVTVMFTDIVGFSSTAETLGPHRLMAWLNNYVQAMSPIVYSHGGIVVRLVGDAFMIVFGAPVPRNSALEIADDAKNAVRAALEMHRTVAALNRTCQRPAERIALRIGIASGDVVAGVLGDSRRQEYNLHGDCVNIAARVEQLEKQDFVPDFETSPTRVLLTASTHRLLDDEFSASEYGAVQLRGFEGRTMVYQLECAS